MTRRTRSPAGLAAARAAAERMNRQLDAGSVAPRTPAERGAMLLARAREEAADGNPVAAMDLLRRAVALMGEAGVGVAVEAGRAA